MNMQLLLMVIQLCVAGIIGLYFWILWKNQRTSRWTIEKNAEHEFTVLRKMRAISLSTPLNESIRPCKMEELIGQKEGVKALHASLCGENPQHVIIYGPPGVGKTAAARMILQEAKKNPKSPFREDAPFIEVDATLVRRDERGIADALLGSVHDPIYQGAGALGHAGIPQPRYGAVSKAHGGILFIDEIGELHHTQMNKLLKVLEDRKVILESAYYHPENASLPKYIHELFQQGLPADFRLVGATTRNPNELPEALRSRCIEIYFKPLQSEDIAQIASQAFHQIGFKGQPHIVNFLTNYASNGRDAIRMVQLCAGLARSESRRTIMVSDIEWVVENSQLTQRNEKKINQRPKIGQVNGLAVAGVNQGLLLNIDAVAIPTARGKGKLNVTGIIDEEETHGSIHSWRRKSIAKSSIENVMVVLRRYGIEANDYDVQLHFSSGIPVDGPSAGIAIASAIASAILQIAVNPCLAMTGELNLHGDVIAVGAITTKLEAAIRAGAKRILIPKENEQIQIKKLDNVEVIPVARLEEVFHYGLNIDLKFLSTVQGNIKKMR